MDADNNTEQQPQDLSNLIPDDTIIRAKAKTWALDTPDTGNTRLRVLFELLDEAWKNRHITWDGYFTDKTFPRTIESLRHMGWQGADLDVLEGLDANEVSLVIGTEEYEGKWRNRVRWVNASAGLFLKNAMDPVAKKSFAAAMKGRILALDLGKPKSAASTKPRPTPAPAAATGNDDIPF